MENKQENDILKKYFLSIIETFGEAICISDSNGIILYINNLHEELTGVQKKELIGKSVYELVNRGIFDIVLNPSIVKNKEPEMCIQSIANGHKVVLNGYPIFDENNNVALVVTYFRDTTKISQLRGKMQEQQELLEVYQQMQVGLNLERVPVFIQSKVMRNLHKQMLIIAQTDATVLVLGETGVGKEVFVRKLHQSSARENKPFVKADCGSIPENLIETELFGYVPGTFSGANKQGKIGLIEAASGGTLFLDEIGDLPLTMQNKLLRILQDKEILRVGATIPQKIDVRIIAATNRDLEKEVKENKFRSDLYYRLNVAVIKIPPLRKRKVEILPLLQNFLLFFCNKYHRHITFSPATEKAFLAYNWPGNIRELENLVLSFVVGSVKTVINASDLPPNVLRNTQKYALETTDIFKEIKSLKEKIENFEKNVLQEAMGRLGNLSAIAEELKIDRTTAFRKMKKYGEK